MIVTNTVEILRYTAFTHEPEGGNPAGIVLDAGELSDAEMLAVAAEVGYSETAFVTGRDDESRTFRVRYFAPSAEVDFCGHATIATSVALAERLGTGRLVFDTNAGEIVVDTEIVDDALLATLTSVPTHPAPRTRSRWPRRSPPSAGRMTTSTPPSRRMSPSAGSNTSCSPPRPGNAWPTSDYDFDGLKSVMTRNGWTTVNLFWRESDERFHSRNPFPVGGVVEDPATGAAAAAFGGYLRVLGTGSSEFTVIQGVDMGRPSTLKVSIASPDGRTRVSGGAVAMEAV